MPPATLLADLLMVVHLAWVAFMVLGLPVGLWLRSPTLRWAHLAGMAATAAFAVVGAYCPLTVWEEGLRWGSGQGPFDAGESFLARILAPVLYPRVSPSLIRWATVAWGAVTLAAAIVRPPGRPRRERSPARPDAPG